MAKKAGAPKLQEDIQTDEELNIFLEKPGLLVLDIYSEWCGPCLGMVNTLRKVKMEIGGDDLYFAICKSDTIEVFKRFRRKSEPTWLFITNKKAVNIMFGTDVPKLSALIAQELQLLTAKIRNYYELDAYQPIEQERRKVKEDAENAAIALEQEKRERKRLDYLNYVTNTIMENLEDMGCTIFGPQVNRDLIKKVVHVGEQMKIQCKERKSIEISMQDFNNIHYDCPNPISDEILEQLEGKELYICFWKTNGTGKEIPKILHDYAKELQTSHTRTDIEDNEEIEVVIPPLVTPLDVKVEIELQEGEIWIEPSEVKLSTRGSIMDEAEEDEENVEEEEDDERVVEAPPAIDLDLDLDLGLDDTVVEEEEEAVEEALKKIYRIKKITIPPIWVPNNHRTHAVLIYTYFRNQTVGFLPPDPEPEPPYIVMAFESYKKRDLILHAERCKDHVPMYGFFTSDEADEAKFIANSLEKYKPVTTNDKIVLKVKKATSHFMLQLAAYGPSYVSPNLTLGHDEVQKFFPPTYKTAEQEAEEANQEAEDQKGKPEKKQAKVQKPQQPVETPETQTDNNNDTNANTTEDQITTQVPADAA